MDLDDEDRAQRFIEQQKLALQAQLDEANEEITRDNELKRQEGDSKIAFQLNPAASSTTTTTTSTLSSTLSASSSPATGSPAIVVAKKKPKAPIIPLFAEDEESAATSTTTTPANDGDDNAAVGSKRFRPDSLPQPPYDITISSHCVLSFIHSFIHSLILISGWFGSY